MDNERRKLRHIYTGSTQRDLNPMQAATLVELENFGWELKFIRRPMFQPIVPVLADPSRTHFAILRSDGTLDESPSIRIRH